MAIVLFDLHGILEQLEHDLGATPDAIAGALAVNPRTLRRWSKGESLPQAEGRARLQALVDLRDRLYTTFSTAESVQVWMRSSNRLLGGLTPLDAARVGRIDAIEHALEALDSGVFV